MHAHAQKPGITCLVIAAFLGCSPDAEQHEDAGTSPILDGGVAADVRIDAPDASSGVDAGSASDGGNTNDSGSIVEDAGVVLDAGTRADGGSACAAGAHWEESVCVSNQRACAIENGVGEQIWHDNGWSDCVRVRCNDGFHEEDESCTANQRACAIENGVGEQIWHDNGWSDCVRVQCNAGFHEEDESCTADQRACVVEHGEGEQLWSSEWSECLVSTCDPGFHLDQNQCLSDTRPCSIENGVGTQDYVGGVWQTCQLSSCNEHFTATEQECIADRQSCVVEHGGGEQTWTGSDWGACIATTCDENFHLENDICVSSIRLCNIAHGAGTETWLAGNWGPCTVWSCVSGYHAENNQCVLDSTGSDLDAGPGAADASDLDAGASTDSGDASTGAQDCDALGSGYRWVDGECRDVDECAEATAPCPANAHCNNTVGSYLCECDVGFRTVDGTGDIACEDINECDGAAHGCDPAAGCVNEPGTFSCGSCPSGYLDVHGDGVLCLDIDGCADEPCFSGVVCTDAQAPATGFSCGVCPLGMSGDGIQCAEMDACASEPCFTNTSCTDLPAPSTGYRCGTCDEGFEDDDGRCIARGASCEEIKSRGRSQGDGIYFVNGNRVFCDMSGAGTKLGDVTSSGFCDASTEGMYQAQFQTWCVFEEPTLFYTRPMILTSSFSQVSICATEPDGVQAFCEMNAPEGATYVSNQYTTGGSALCIHYSKTSNPNWSGTSVGKPYVQNLTCKYARAFWQTCAPNDESCVEPSGTTCGQLAHGELETRTRFATGGTPTGTSCQSELQARRCDDGTWTSWSGTFAYRTCNVCSDNCEALSMCSGAPCFEGVACSEREDDTEFVCESCPQGYVGDGRDCENVDECALGIDACDPLVSCVDEMGSYSCGACPSGFTDVNANGTLCAENN